MAVDQVVALAQRLDKISSQLSPKLASCVGVIMYRSIPATTDRLRFISFDNITQPSEALTKSSNVVDKLVVFIACEISVISNSVDIAAEMSNITDLHYCGLRSNISHRKY